MEILFLLGVIAAMQGAEARVDIHPIDTNVWRATWHLAAPVRELRFARPAQFYRERVWRVVTPGYTLSRDGDVQLIRLRPGSEARPDLAVEFPVDTTYIPKEYELFEAFSSGAVALYTGHFYATADGGNEIRTLRLTPPAHAHAVVHGVVHSGAFTWTDEGGDGTYVYFGETQPIETPHLLAILDPGMPDWLHRTMSTYLPRIFAAYGDRLGAALPWKPMVLFSVGELNSPALSFGGGSLPGVLQMNVSGAGWLDSTNDGLEQAVHLMAHEAVHFWNGNLVTAPGGGAAWMHEGSADALALELLRRFGIVTGERARVLAEEAFNRCALDLNGFPVHDAHRHGAFIAFYSCGHVLGIWTEAALQKVRPDADLFTFWSALIAAAETTGRAYDEDLYFGVLRRLGVADSVAAAMRGSLDAGDLVGEAVPWLADVGVVLVPRTGSPPLYFQQELGRRALSHIMASVCGRYSFSTVSRGFRTEALPDCPGFDRARHVSTIAGQPVQRSGADAYRAVELACSKRDTIRLADTRGEGVTVTCTAPLAPAPPWRMLQRR